jgi:lipoprotein-anchoring transpeptidase ErfK/SrfK
MTKIRVRCLAALTFTLLGGQVALASAASAGNSNNGLLGLGLFAPPAKAPAAPAAPAPAPAPAQAAPATSTPQQVEQRLEALRYDVGAVDGNIDDAAKSAIMAFQKVYGLPRTGVLTDALATQIMTTHGTPPAMVPGGEPNRVEVSLARQVLFLYQNGSLYKILAVSTGTSETPTPTGTFRMYRSEAGWHTSRLGRLYNAQYFVGGYAIHGSLSVPAHPASHGCVRLPMHSAEWFPNHVPRGTQVVVVAT